MTGPDRMKASARQFQRHRHQKRVVLAHSVHVMGTHRKRASAELPTPCPMFPNASLRASSSWVIDKFRNLEIFRGDCLSNYNERHSSCRKHMDH
jgi:hypothetical protein